MFSSGAVVSYENKKRLYAVLPFVIFFSSFFILISTNPFFLDKDILFSKIAYLPPSTVKLPIYGQSEAHLIILHSLHKKTIDYISGLNYSY